MTFKEYIEFFEKSGDNQYHFKEAADLIMFIKDRYHDYFSICVAGYPDRHPRSETFEEDTQHLLQKVNYRELRSWLHIPHLNLI